MTDFAPIASGFYLEGLLIDGDAIWYSDIGRGGVWKVGSDVALLPDRIMIGGLLLNDDGKLLVGGVGGIAWVDPATGAAGTVVDGLPGANEMRADADGNLLFGTVDLAAILAGRRPGPATIYRLSTNGDLTSLRDGLSFSNGFEIGADGATLFFNESFAATRAFPFDAHGRLGEPLTLAAKPDCDGMAQDAEGNLWITGFSSGELLCVAPDGTVVRTVARPGSACTNVHFGGADLRDLYVTIVDPASAQALAEGRPLTERNSTLFRTRSPVAGAPRRPASLTLS